MPLTSHSQHPQTFDPKSRFFWGIGIFNTDVSLGHRKSRIDIKQPFWSGYRTTENGSQKERREIGDSKTFLQATKLFSPWGNFPGNPCKLMQIDTLYSYRHKLNQKRQDWNKMLWLIHFVALVTIIYWYEFDLRSLTLICLQVLYFAFFAVS